MKLNPLAAKLFSLENRVVLITGGAGLLGLKHAEIVAAAGGIPLLVDLDEERARSAAEDLKQRFGSPAKGLRGDVTSQPSVLELSQAILQEFGRIDVLINNAANNPSVEKKSGFSRVENFPLEQWEADVDVGLKGAFLCTQVFGGQMARDGGGVVVNVSSEYGVNSPDQRLYRVEGLPDDQQPVKPVTYTVVKSGLIGMTRYFATYWGAQGVRVNAISLAGVQNGQPEEFVRRYVSGVPLGRMAQPDEYQGSILYLCSDASRFLTGANLIVDGGKSCW